MTRRVQALALAVGSVFVVAVVLYGSRRLTEAGDFQVVWKAMHAFVHGRSPFTVHDYRFPPGALLVLWPLGLFPENTAHLLFLFTSASAAVASAVLFGRLVLEQTPVFRRSYLWGAGLVLLFTPVISDLHLGNISCLLLLLATGGLLFAVRGKWVACGVALGIGLAVKPLFVGFLLMLVVLHKWRAIAATLVTVAVPSAAGLLIAPNKGAFFHNVLALEASAVPAEYHLNISIYGAGLALHLPVGVTTVLRLAALGAGCYVASRLARDADRPVVLRLAEALAAVELGVVLSLPLGLDFYLVALVPLVVTVVHPMSMVRRPLVLAALFVVGSPDILAWHHLTSWTQETATLRVLAGMLLLVVVLWAYSPRRFGAHSLGRAAGEAVNDLAQNEQQPPSLTYAEGLIHEVRSGPRSSLSSE